MHVVCDLRLVYYAPFIFLIFVCSCHKGIGRYIRSYLRYLTQVTYVAPKLSAVFPRRFP